MTDDGARRGGGRGVLRREARPAAFVAVGMTAVIGLVALVWGVVALMIDDLAAGGSTAAVAETAPEASTTASASAPASASPSPSATGEPDGVSVLVDAGWVAEMSAVTGIPERALAAYAGASIRVRSQDPSCGLDWATLAGIGFVESEHGTVTGGSIDGDGMQTPSLIGIALDGTTTDAVPDTDGGVLDGDTTWDRAVGPMQFTPGTWAQHGTDGSGDGEADPQQIDDAALSAGLYLCAVGVDLTTDAGWIAAIGAYNDTTDYNNRVAEATSAYRTAG